MGLFNPPQSLAVDFYPIEQKIDSLSANSHTSTIIEVNVTGENPNPVTILSSSIERRGASMRNTSQETVWIGLTLPFTVESCVANIEPGGYYEFPCVYTGQIYGFSDTGAGQLSVIDYYRSANV